MDQEMNRPSGAADGAAPIASLSRRQALRYGLYGLTCASAGGAAVYYVKRRAASITTAEVFKNDAPGDDLWRLWDARGWLREARHYRRLGRNVQCQLCPNECVLEPGDRSHCRDRVNRDGTLYRVFIPGEIEACRRYREERRTSEQQLKFPSAGIEVG